MRPDNEPRKPLITPKVVSAVVGVLLALAALVEALGGTNVVP